MNVAILGCGPAGLLCTHAADRAGAYTDVFSIKEKSVIPGSQHLHGPIPGITPHYPEGTIQFVRMGDEKGYAEKVYGDSSRATGWDNYLQVYPSWNVQRAYDNLWERYEKNVVNQNVTEALLHRLVDAYDMVVSTVPAEVLCCNEHHTFRSQEYWIKVLPTPQTDRLTELVVYNGLPEDHWYRWSILGGKCSIETTSKADAADADWIQGWKAVDNDCDCWPGIERAGRWAEWTHGITLHKAFLKATRLMEGM